jgi:hypothetical protein
MVAVVSDQSNAYRVCVFDWPVFGKMLDLQPVFAKAIPEVEVAAEVWIELV